MLNNIIPTPKSVKRGNGIFQPKAGQVLYHTSGTVKTAMMLAEEWPEKICLKEIEAPSPILFIGEEYKPFKDRVVHLDEAYFLDICEDSVQIAARTEKGLYYGYGTLSQLNDEEGLLPIISIYDYPDLSMRGIHFDLKGVLPTVEYIKNHIKQLGRYKINTILMEYEDKFPFRTYPEISSLTVLTRDELKDILDTARDCFIEVIPLLQCFGHTEYILKHDQFKKLGEDGTRQMLCPLETGSFELFKELMEEILEFHPDSRYFHIGADEAWILGSCPRCSEYVKEHGKPNLFTEYVQKVTQYVITKGMKPIMWDDMFHRENAFHLIKELPKGTALNFWLYQEVNEESPGIRINNRQYTSKQWIAEDPGKIMDFGAWLEDLPQKDQDLVQKYKYGEKYPMFGHPLPWIRKYLDEGCEVIGASAVKGGSNEGYNSLYPDFSVRFNNTSIWAIKAREEGITGVISTSWSKYNSAAPSTQSWESAVYSIVSSAEHYWNAGCTREQFDDKFSVNYLGAETSLTKAIEYMEKGRDTGNVNYLRSAEVLLEDALTKAKRNNLLAEVLLDASRYQMLVIAAERTMWTARPQIWYLQEKDALRRETREKFVQQLEEISSRLKKWYEVSLTLYKKMMPEAEAQELLGTKTDGLLFQLEALSEKLKDQG